MVQTQLLVRAIKLFKKFGGKIPEFEIESMEVGRFIAKEIMDGLPELDWKWREGEDYWIGKAKGISLEMSIGVQRRLAVNLLVEISDEQLRKAVRLPDADPNGGGKGKAKKTGDS